MMDIEELRKPHDKPLYFEHERAYFRKHAGYEGAVVHDVLGEDGNWKPYKGDRAEPVAFGRLIDETDLPKRK